MRIVVTGGSGFIGRHVVGALLARGDQPVVVARRRFPGDVESVVGDLRDPAVVAAAVRPGIDGIVHLAGVKSVLRSVEDPHGVFLDNVAVTEALLERNRATAGAPVVFASTNALCGDVGDRLIDESVVPRPLTPYGASKAACEALLSAYAGSYGIRSVALRITNVYGPGMDERDGGIVAAVLRAARRDEPLVVHGDGGQRRDYLYVTDAVDALLLALGLADSAVFTVGAGRDVSVNELVELAAVAAGRPIAVRHVDAEKGEMPRVAVDAGRFRAAGFAPAVSLEEGLRETWRSLQAMPDPASAAPARPPATPVRPPTAPVRPPAPAPAPAPFADPARPTPPPAAGPTGRATPGGSQP